MVTHMAHSDCVIAGRRAHTVLALLFCTMVALRGFSQENGTNAPPPTNAPPVLPGTNAVVITNAADAAVSTNAAAEAPPAEEDAKQPPPLDPRTFNVHPGFRVDVVATEPLVYAPSAMAFDARGRLFVTEMRDWPGRRDSNPHLGRVRILEDTDRDGTFDSSTIFAENLAWPSAIACFNEGVYVAATPDIIYLKDTAGHGTANVHTVVFTGFGGTNSPLAERLLGGLVWGPDLRLHGVTAGLAGYIANPTAADLGRVDLYAQDFSFNPRTLMMTTESGPGYAGVAFDLRGRKYITGEQSPLQVVMSSPYYYGRNPTYAPAQDVLSVLHPATPIFPFTANTLNDNRPIPTAAARTRDGRTNLVSSTWLKPPRAITIYKGHLFPPAFVGNAFLADDQAGVIHRAVLVDSGLAVTASRATDEAGTEFLRSSDPGFKPRSLAVGPDGALYIGDMRESRSMGRIYRVVPANFRQPQPPRLDKLGSRDLVALLAHTNAWHRETAARLIWERQDAAATDLLTMMLRNSRLPTARLHAANLLTALRRLDEAWISSALRDADDRVRVQALQAVESLAMDAPVSDALWANIQALGRDPSINFRHQLALTLGSVRRDERNPVLAGILMRDPENIWIQDAVLSSLAEFAGPVFTLLASDAGFRNSPPGGTFLRQLASMVGTAGQANGVGAVINWAASAPPREALGIVAALGEGLNRNGNSLERVDLTRRLQAVYIEGLDASLNDALPESLRLEAMRLVAVGPYSYEEASDLLMLLPGTTQPAAVQAAAIAALGHFNSPLVFTNMVARSAAIPPALRPNLLGALIRRAERVPEVVSLMERGSVNPAQLLYEQANFLRFYPNRDVSEPALQILRPLVRERPEAMKTYQPALRLRGAPDNGRRIFLNRCASCHRLGFEGQSVGPDLTGIKTQGKDAIANAILEPNAQIRPGFETWFVQTRGMENLTGVVDLPHPTTVVLRRPGGQRITMSRGNIGFIEQQAWSLMPEGLEQGLSPQNFADLLEYLMIQPR